MPQSKSAAAPDPSVPRTVKARLITQPDREIDVPVDEYEVLRLQRLLVEDDPKPAPAGTDDKQGA